MPTTAGRLDGVDGLAGEGRGGGRGRHIASRRPRRPPRGVVELRARRRRARPWPGAAGGEGGAGRATPLLDFGPSRPNSQRPFLPQSYPCPRFACGGTWWRDGGAELRSASGARGAAGRGGECSWRHHSHCHWTSASSLKPRVNNFKIIDNAKFCDKKIQEIPTKHSKEFKY